MSKSLECKIQVKITRSRYLPSQYIDKNTIQGLVVEGLTVEDIWKGDVKGVKENGARNIGQGHRVKVPAESVHLGEALCKVWWL